jgi:oligopeptide transport system substrate-binding protein
MKLFYFTAIVVVGLMLASPMFILPEEKQFSVSQIVARYEPGGTPVYKDAPVVRYDTYGSAVRSIDPTTCGDTTSAGIQGSFYEGPYTYHYLLRDKGRPIIVPQLASAMPRFSEDKRTVTIPLRQGVKYQRNPCFGMLNDETPKTRTVRAEDFVLAFQRIADYHNVNVSLAWAFLSNKIVGLDQFREKTRQYKAGDFSRYDLDVEGLQAIDEHTLQLKLTEPFPQLTMILALNNYAPCPREAVDYWLTLDEEGNPIPVPERSVEFHTAEMVVGTGPYVLDTFARKNRIVLRRNPDFREDTYPTAESMLAIAGERGFEKAARSWIDELRNRGLLDDAGKAMPFIDVVSLKFVAETYPNWMLFLSKRKDATGIPPELYEGVISPDKDLAESWRKRGIYLSKSWYPAVYWFAFNMEDPVLGASKSLRQAMCLSYDVESHIKVLSNGRGRRAVNTVPGDFKAGIAAGPGPYYRFDVEAAKKKIAQAKQELAEKGLLADGKIPVIKVDLSDSSYARNMAEFARRQFARIGVRIEPVYNDWPTLQQKVHNKLSQIYTMGWHADYYDSETFLQLYYSPNIKKGTNNTNYSNPEYDKLFERARVMFDSPERTKLYAEMIHLVGEDCPVLLLSQPQTYLLCYAWYRNVLQHPIGYGFGKYRRIDVELRRQMGGRE